MKFAVKKGIMVLICIVFVLGPPCFRSLSVNARDCRKLAGAGGHGVQESRERPGIATQGTTRTAQRAPTQLGFESSRLHLHALQGFSAL